jgi:hypothetical protein
MPAHYSRDEHLENKPVIVGAALVVAHMGWHKVCPYKIYYQIELTFIT